MIDPIFVVAREGQTIGIVFTNEDEARTFKDDSARNYPGENIHFCQTVGDVSMVDPPERAPIKPIRVGP